MRIDETTLEGIKITREKFQQQYDIDISEEEIIDIVESQLYGIVYGLKKGASVSTPIFGRFLFIDRKRTLKEIYSFKKLKEFYSEIEYNQLELQGKINTIKRNKARWLKERKTKLTVIEVVKMPNISNSRLIYDKLHELLEIPNNDVNADNMAKFKELYGE